LSETLSILKSDCPSEFVEHDDNSAQELSSLGGFHSLD